MNYPIPYDLAQQAVALSIADVLQKQQANKKLIEFPYATAFFKFYLGQSKPKKAQVAHYTHGNQTLPKITEAVDTLIKSNGRVSGCLYDGFILNLFPCLKTLSDQRFDNSFCMKSQRDTNVQKKQKSRHEQFVDEQQQHVFSLDKLALSPWVTECELDLKDAEMKDILRNWYCANIGSSFDFNCDYSDLSARDTALALSYL